MTLSGISLHTAVLVIVSSFLSASSVAQQTDPCSAGLVRDYTYSDRDWRRNFLNWALLQNTSEETQRQNLTVNQNNQSSRFGLNHGQLRTQTQALYSQFRTENLEQSAELVLTSTVRPDTLLAYRECLRLQRRAPAFAYSRTINADGGTIGLLWNPNVPVNASVRLEPPSEPSRARLVTGRVLRPGQEAVLQFTRPRGSEFTAIVQFIIEGSSDSAETIEITIPWVPEIRERSVLGLTRSSTLSVRSNSPLQLDSQTADIRTTAGWQIFDTPAIRRISNNLDCRTGAHNHNAMILVDNRSETGFRWQATIQATDRNCFVAAEYEVSWVEVQRILEIQAADGSWSPLRPPAAVEGPAPQ